MPTIKINNVDYDTDKLSDEAKAQLVTPPVLRPRVGPSASSSCCDYKLHAWPMPKLYKLRYLQPLLAIRLNSIDVRSRLSA
jgi:hypothetical protein